MPARLSENKREEWLKATKTLMMKAVERLNVFQHELCPDTLVDEADRKIALKRVAGLSTEIGASSGRLALIERDGAIGSMALIGVDDEIARTSLAILAISRLSATAGREVRRVNDLVDLVGARDPIRCLGVRNLFRWDGLLHPHVHLSQTPVLDESVVYLREAALNRVVGQASDESERRCDAVGIAGQWDVYPRRKKTKRKVRNIMANDIAENIQPLMHVAAVLDAKGFLEEVAKALDDAFHPDMANMVRVIIDPPENKGENN